MTQQGVYTSLEALVGLQQYASTLTHNRGRIPQQQFSGSHLSPLRGRGLDFDELKPYFPGDDIRHMDWRATQRTGRPHVRSFTEEKEQTHHLVLDQSVSMFFGSVKMMKSVAAAKVAALLGWQSVDLGDRVCLTLFNDTEIFPGTSQRSRSQWISKLSLISQFNSNLNANISSSMNKLGECLDKVLSTKPHRQVIYLISDFKDITAKTIHLVQALAQKNEIRMILIYDPLETKLPTDRQLPITNGDHQLMLDTGNTQIQKDFALEFIHNQNALLSLCQSARLGSVSMLSLSTAGSLIDQLRSMNGGLR